MRERNRGRAKQTVGYKQPPKHTQFKPGKSGNPNGRPKGTLNLKTDLERELKATLTVRENGRALRLSKQRVAVKVFVDKALKGDVRALELLLKTRERQAPLEAEPVEETLEANDEAFLRQALKRLRPKLETAELRRVSKK